MCFGARHIIHAHCNVQIIRVQYDDSDLYKTWTHTPTKTHVSISRESSMCLFPVYIFDSKTVTIVNYTITDSFVCSGSSCKWYPTEATGKFYSIHMYHNLFNQPSWRTFWAFPVSAVKTMLQGFPDKLSGKVFTCQCKKHGSWILIWDYPTCCRVTKPKHQNYWACVLEPGAAATEAHAP